MKKIKNKNHIAFLLIVTFLFNGCVSKLFSIGETETYCNENGCNYKDHGVCASPLEILESKDDLSEIEKRNKEQEDENSWF